MNINHAIENLKSEFKNIKFLSKKELQQLTIAVIISGIISSISFSLIDILMQNLLQFIITI